MQLEPQVFLDMVEQTKKLCFFDLESTGLGGDYNSVLVVAVKPFGAAPIVRTCKEPGNDEALVKWAAEELGKYECWVSYYGRGFDVKMLRSRMLDAGMRTDLPYKHHIDMYFSVVASKLNSGRKSQAHVLSWLYPEDKEEAKILLKMTVSAKVWNQVLRADTRAEAMKTLTQRCARDTIGLQGLYVKTRHLIRDVKR